MKLLRSCSPFPLALALRATLLLFATRGEASVCAIDVMPCPERVVVDTPQLRWRGLAFDPATSAGGDDVSVAVGRLRAEVGHAPLGAMLVVEVAGSRAVELDEDERYYLDVAQQRVVLRAMTATGALRGLETLAQVARRPPRHELRVVDAPRFPWRGLLLDPSRRFLSVATTKRTLAAMAAAKLNVLHWHLSDDQAFRLAIDALPTLAAARPDGQAYSRADVDDIVSYARARGIRVVPEIDVPGHTTALVAAFPELGTLVTPQAPAESWGVFHEALHPLRETTYARLDTLFGHVVEWFPDGMIHIGGDEVSGVAYRTNPETRAAGTPQALELRFHKRVIADLAQRGVQAIGWDEVLQPGLPAHAWVHAWRGLDGVERAARAGHDVILSWGYYLVENASMAEHLAVDPLPMTTTLTASEQARVRGGEACAWGELIDDAVIDGRIWPRAAAIAERLWSPTVDVDDVVRRAPYFLARLSAHGVDLARDQRRMVRRLVGEDGVDDVIAALRWLEPRKQWGRFEGRQWRTTSPLVRLVDAAWPEAPRAHALAALVRSRSPEARSELATIAEQAHRARRVVEQSVVAREASAAFTRLEALARAMEARLDGAPPEELRARLDEALPAGDLEVALVPLARALLP